MSFLKLSILLSVLQFSIFSYAEQVNFGNGSIVTGEDAAAFGQNTEATGDSAMAFGVFTVASDFSATAFGWNAVASGTTATAFGYSTEASGSYATAFGERTLASGPYATAFGMETVASGRHATTFGNFTEADGFNATAFGLRARAIGSHATAFGVRTLSDGYNTTAFGGGTTASGFTATAFGESTVASGRSATAFGYSTEANGYALTSIGRYNATYPDIDPIEPNVTDPLFIVGNGVEEQRSNALTVFADGRTEVYGNLLVTGTITQSSDERLKENIAPSTLGLDKVLALEAKTYTLTTDVNQQTQVGFIAQEVEAVLPELVRTDRQGHKSINYGQLTAVLVEAIKTLTEALCRVSPSDPVCQR